MKDADQDLKRAFPLGATSGHTIDQAYAHCEKITRNHYENFPVASRLLPKVHRRAICAIYAFSRGADDFSDESIFEGVRLKRLDEWKDLLLTCEEKSTHPVFIALGDTIRRWNLPVSLFCDLLTAFRRDVNVNRHRTFDDLLDYCRYSANPIGRLVLHLFGLFDPVLGKLSDSICTALQLTNFWQDIAIDLRKGRIYLPQADLQRFGVVEEHLDAGRVTPGFVQLMNFQINRTRSLFHKGLPLVSNPIKGSCLPLPQSAYRRLSYELRLTYLGGIRILERIETQGYDVFKHRPTLSVRDKLTIVYRAWGFETWVSGIRVRDPKWPNRSGSGSMIRV